MAQALGFPPPPGLQSQLPTHADSWKQCLWVRQQGSCHFLGDLDCMPIPSFQPQPLQIFGVWINRWEHLQINFWKCHHWVSSYFKTVARTSFFTYKLSILKEKLCMMVILVIQLPNNPNTLLPYLSPIKKPENVKKTLGSLTMNFYSVETRNTSPSTKLRLELALPPSAIKVVLYFPCLNIFQKGLLRCSNYTVS